MTYLAHDGAEALFPGADAGVTVNHGTPEDIINLTPDLILAGAFSTPLTRRLAKAIGYSGWDELRAALTEARRPSQTSPFSGRARSRRHGPNADVALVADKLEAEAAGLPRIPASPIVEAARALHDAKRIWITGYRSCRSVAELLNYELRLFRPEQVQLVGTSGPDDLDLGAFRPGERARGCSGLHLCLAAGQRRHQGGDVARGLRFLCCWGHFLKITLRCHEAIAG